MSKTVTVTATVTTTETKWRWSRLKKVTTTTKERHCWREKAGDIAPLIGLLGAPDSTISLGDH